MTSPTGRSLFPPYFLEDGIRARAEWKKFDGDALREFREKLTPVVADFSRRANPGESDTERELIHTALDLLGWRNAYLTQQGADGEIPDALLFPNSESREEAARKPKIAERYPLGIAVMENKKWNCRLDRAGDDGRRTPSTQILGYLSRAEVISNRRILWGILTNGRLWRLYYQLARSRSEEYFECDICDALKSDDELKIFMLMFRRESFLPDVGGLTFHQSALEESRKWEARVTGELSEIMLLEVLPILAREIGKRFPQIERKTESERLAAYLYQLRDTVMTLLFRLLFVLYAEDRGLLPISGIYTLNQMRDEIAVHKDGSGKFSKTESRYFRGFSALCRMIDKGDETQRLPPYNGGLFASENVVGGGWLGVMTRKEGSDELSPLPDSVFAPLIDLMSRRNEDGKRRRINFSNLSVQHLGNIYERLLEREFFINPVGDVGVRLNRYARKGSGGYYTPEELVRLIIERTLAPLLEERRGRFRKEVARLKKVKAVKDALDILNRADPADAFLNLKVCDPAMGSGHFLVSLVDYLADQILVAMDEAESDAGEFNYKSPLANRINFMRQRIRKAAKQGGWTLDENHLDDRQLVRRMILKRVIFGADKNPMAVELAKVSLWLHTFTVGAPLSFLDHHLRRGDSLFGEWTESAVAEVEKMSGSLFSQRVREWAESAANYMGKVEKNSDAVISEAKESARWFEQFQGEMKDYDKLLTFIHGLRWLNAEDSHLSTKEQRERRKERAAIAGNFLKRVPSREESFSPFGYIDVSPEEDALLEKILVDLRGQEDFLNWEVAFPGVWRVWESKFDGGFDAVIGNPPWDKIRMEPLEWFASREPTIAHAQHAAERKRAIAKIIDEGGKMADDFQRAKSRDAALAQVAHDCGEYTLLGNGDMNLYSLFVERAMDLINKGGMVGLLTPSGIYGDKTASEFFRKISTGGKLRALIDFENRGTFFPDVHRSFKFCALIFGGEKQKFESAELAFYLHDVEEIKRRKISLVPDDFARVNPNTGNAPIFRSQRDADLTLDIYRRLPVLSECGKEPVYPMRYLRMFDMASDSALFKNAKELQADGFYPVRGNFYKRGKDEFAPLYEGKMVQAFDHRAASIVFNPANVRRPRQPQDAAAEQREDIKWLPTPQIWVNIENRTLPEKADQIASLPCFIGIKDVTAPTNDRTMITVLLPSHCAAGHTLPVLIPQIPKRPALQSTKQLKGVKTPIEKWEEEVRKRIHAYEKWSPLLCANLNSFALDFVARQKVQGQHLSLFIIEQLPVIPPAAYEKKIGDKTAAAIVRDHVLRLSYAAEDMRPFAISQGCKADPFKWDDKIRRHLRARLDALYFILYGISREDAEYILSTFPIVKRNDEKNHGGRYLTRDLILRYISALSAGDYQSEVDELS